MMFAIKRALCVIAPTAFLCASTVAHASGPVALTEGQLDSVTAAQGGPAALVSAGAAASGLLTIGSTLTTAVTEVANSPFDGSTAQATGVAAGYGTNGVASPGQSSAAVGTYTEAPGNVAASVGWNMTFYNNGLTLAIGVSSSTGDLVPGLP